MFGLQLYLLEIYTIKWNVDAKPDHLLHSEYNIPSPPPPSKISIENWDKANIIISKGYHAVVKHTLTMCMSTPYISSHLALFK